MKDEIAIGTSQIIGQALPDSACTFSRIQNFYVSGNAVIGTVRRKSSVRHCPTRLAHFLSVSQAMPDSETLKMLKMLKC